MKSTKRCIRFWNFLVGALLICFCMSIDAAAMIGEADSTMKGKIAESYGKFPLSFVQNNGLCPNDGH